MSGIFWQISALCTAGIFLLVTLYRLVAIVKLPVHLRWELAPIPHEKSKYKHGGSYLEEYEWWKKPRKRSFSAIVIYMAREIIVQITVWKNNRLLWPFSLVLHWGIYLFILALILYFINALLVITAAPLSTTDVFNNFITVITAAGCVAGAIGSVGLMILRLIKARLKNFNTFSILFRLFFLAAVFISGGIAMLMPGNYAAEMVSFTRGIITLDSAIAVSTASGIHIIISLFFIIYLPFTSMIHFITKLFTYHAVRWNDAPQDSRITGQVKDLEAQHMTWSGAHGGGSGDKSWGDITGETGEKEKS